MERLQQQMKFILEVDKVKQIIRQTYLADGSRKENDAEHSWHLALMAVLLKEYANEEVDLAKVIPTAPPNRSREAIASPTDSFPFAASFFFMIAYLYLLAISFSPQIITDSKKHISDCCPKCIQNQIVHIKTSHFCN